MSDLTPARRAIARRALARAEARLAAAEDEVTAARREYFYLLKQHQFQVENTDAASRIYNGKPLREIL